MMRMFYDGDEQPRYARVRKEKNEQARIAE